MYKKNEISPSYYDFMNSSKKMRFDKDMHETLNMEERLYDQGVKKWKAFCLNGELMGITSPSQNTTLAGAPQIVSIGGVARWKLQWRAQSDNVPCVSNGILDPMEEGISTKERQSRS